MIITNRGAWQSRWQSSGSQLAVWKLILAPMWHSRQGNWHPRWHSRKIGLLLSDIECVLIEIQEELKYDWGN